MSVQHVPVVHTLHRASRETLRCMTMGGLEARALHDEFWRSRGITVVRNGQKIIESSGCYLLMSQSAMLRAPGHLAETWHHRVRGAVCVDLHSGARSSAAREYQERVIHDPVKGSVHIQRVHPSAESLRESGASLHCYITWDRAVAEAWAASHHAARAAQLIRAKLPVRQWRTQRVEGELLQVGFRDDERALLCWLMMEWDDAPATIGIHQRGRTRIWIGEEAEVPDSVGLPAGTIIPDGGKLSDAIFASAPVSTIEPRRACAGRAFDIAFSMLAIMLTLPLWPLIALLIKLEDGGPVLFSHARQGRGGREFQCLKFRTMRQDAERIKQMLLAQNVCDGAQFYLRDDPRQTHVGRWLRRFHLDELPQFVNVLRGEMSVVGPRPSPDGENRFCPAWRDARLSVRPGITGLWQVRRTREPGHDFQEWIRHDIDYVQSRSCIRNICIIATTIRRMICR